MAVALNIKRLSFAIVVSLVTSLLGYLQWGGGNGGFLFTLEWEVLQKLVSSPREAAHPFTLLPLMGQILLVWALVDKTPRIWKVIGGISGIALLYIMILIIGILSLSPAITFSSLPFLISAIVTLRIALKTRKNARV